MGAPTKFGTFWNMFGRFYYALQEYRTGKHPMDYVIEGGDLMLMNVVQWSI